MNKNEALKTAFTYNLETGQIFWNVDSVRMKKGEEAGFRHSQIRRHVINYQRTQYRREDLIWYFGYGSFPEERLYHVNENKFDDKLKNLILMEDRLFLDSGVIKYQHQTQDFIVRKVPVGLNNFACVTSFYEAKELYLKYNFPPKRYYPNNPRA